MSMYPGYPNYINYGYNFCPQTPPTPCGGTQQYAMPAPVVAPYVVQQCPPPPMPVAVPVVNINPSNSSMNSCCPPTNSMSTCNIGFDQYLNAMSLNNMLQQQNASLINELNHYANDRSQSRTNGDNDSTMGGNTRERELEKANIEKTKKLVEEMSALEGQLEVATDEGQRESIRRKITIIEEQIEATSGGNAGVKKFREKIERLEKELEASGGGKANVEKSKKIITEITELEGQLFSASNEGQKEGIRKKITTLAEELASSSASGGNIAVKKFFSMFQRLEAELKKTSQMSTDEGVKKLLSLEQEKNKKLAAASDALKTAVLKCETVPNINQVKADINNKKYDGNLEEKSFSNDGKS